MWKWAHFEKGNYLKQTSMCCRLGSTKSLVSFKHSRMWLKIGSDLDDEFPCISQVPLLGSSFVFLVHFWWCFFHLSKKYPDIQINEFSTYKSTLFPPWLLEGFINRIWRQAHGPYVSVMQQARSIPLSPHRILYQQQPRPSSTSSTFLDFLKKKITWKQTSWVRAVFLHDSSNVCWAKKPVRLMIKS